MPMSLSQAKLEAQVLKIERNILSGAVSQQDCDQLEALLRLASPTRRFVRPFRRLTGDVAEGTGA